LIQPTYYSLISNSAALLAHIELGLERAIANGRSVCPSVRPFVTLESHIYAVQDIEIHFAPYDRAMLLVS